MQQYDKQGEPILKRKAEEEPEQKAEKQIKPMADEDIDKLIAQAIADTDVQTSKEPEKINKDINIAAAGA